MTTHAYTGTESNVLIGSLSHPYNNIKKKIVIESSWIDRYLEKVIWTQSAGSYEFFDAIVTPERLGLQNVSFSELLSEIFTHPSLDFATLEEGCYKAFMFHESIIFKVLTREFERTNGFLLPKFLISNNGERTLTDREIDFTEKLHPGEKFLVRVNHTR